MKYARLLVLVMGIAAVDASSAADTPGERLWPVPLRPALSSNFCEYREGRFHAGIDVRTYGREGVPCRAVADGSVTRVRASSFGYGKALHVTLEDGEEVLYGHLAEFSPALEESLSAAQHRAGRYHVDFLIPRGAFPVERGEVIAYSGATGTVGPHLHLETRVNDQAVNPFLRGFAIPDHEPPVFTRIGFTPLAPGATVDGRHKPLEIPLRRGENGGYSLADTLRLSGSVGVVAGVFDRLNSASGRLAPYRVDVFADDSLVTAITLERFAFVHAGEADLLYHAGAQRARGTHLFELYERAGETLPGRRYHRGGSLLPAAARRVHTGRVVAQDVAGNRSEVTFHYREDAAGSDARAAAPNLAPDLEGSFFLDGFAVISEQEPRRVLRERGGEGPAAARDSTLRAVDLVGRVLPLTRAAGEDSATVYATAFAGTSGAAVRFPSLGIALAVPPDGLYGDDVVFATRANTDRARDGETLTLVSDPVRVGPIGWVTPRGFDIHIDAGNLDPRDAIFCFDTRRRSWSYLSGTRDTTGITARSSRPGVFAVVRDTAPPWLGEPRLEWPESYFTAEPYPEVVIPVDDPGAGVDDARISVTVGGAVCYARWDFAKKKIVVPLRGESIIGTQPVHVVVFDKAGNQSVADVTFYFRER